MISPLAHVDPSAQIGENVTIHPFAYIDADTQIGDNCEIMSYTSILRGTTVGKNNKFYQGSIIGAEPQDFRWKGQPTKCYIGDDNVIREHVIINRGIRYEGGTRIGSNCFIMAKSHIGHDSVIEGKCVIGNGVAVAGDAYVGKCTILSSGVIIHEKNRIGKWVTIKGGCRIGSNVPPYSIMAHNPVEFFGVNARIMRMKGFTDEEIEIAAKSFRHIYQSQTSVFNALRRIEADVEESPLRDDITSFIRQCGLKIVAIDPELNG